jgi:hypothetical protein
MASPARVIAKFLVDRGIVVAPANPPQPWQVQVTEEPDKPDNTITVYNTGANTFGRLMRSGDRTEKPTVQIRLRALNDKDGYAKGQAIQNTLDKVGLATSLGGLVWVYVTVDSVRYTLQAVHITTPLTYIGEEEKNARLLYTINALMTITPIPA